MTDRLIQLIEEHRTLRPRTKKIYADAVKRFLEAQVPHTPAAFNAWLERLLASGMAPQTVNLYRAALRWAAKRANEVDGTPNFARPVEAFKVERVHRQPRSLTPAEVKALLNTTATDSWVDLRDRGILLLGIRIGLRRHEIAKARWEELSGDGVLTVVGKGGKRDEVRLDATTHNALLRWRKVSQGAMHAERNGPIFLPLQPRLGKWPGMTAEGVYHVVKQRATQAGIENMGVHTLRHTFVSLALRGGAEPWRVSQAARHRNLSTTLGFYAHDLEADEGRPVGAVLDGVLGELEE